MSDIDLSGGDTPITKRPPNRAELLAQKHQLAVTLTSPRLASPKNSPSDKIVLESLLSTLRDTSGHWFNRLTALRKLQTLLKSSSLDISSLAQPIFDSIMLQFKESRHSLTQSALLTLTTLADVIKLPFLSIVTPHIPSILALCRTTESESVVSNASLTLRNIIQSCSLNSEVLSHLLASFSAEPHCNAELETSSQAIVMAVKKGYFDTKLISIISDWIMSFNFDLMTCPFRKLIYTTLVDAGLYPPQSPQDHTPMSPTLTQVEPSLTQVEPFLTQVEPDETSQSSEKVNESQTQMVEQEIASFAPPSISEMNCSEHSIVNEEAPPENFLKENTPPSTPIKPPLTPRNQSNLIDLELKYAEEVKLRVELQDILTQYETMLTSMVDQQNELIAVNTRSLLTENSELTQKYNELELNFKQLSLRYEELKRIVVGLKENEQSTLSKLTDTINQKESIEKKYVLLKEKAEAAIEEARNSTETFKKREVLLKNQISELETSLGQKDEEISRISKNFSILEKNSVTMTNQIEELKQSKNEMEVEFAKKEDHCQVLANQISRESEKVKQSELKYSQEVEKNSILSQQLSDLQSKLSKSEEIINHQSKELSSTRNLTDEVAKLKGRLYDSMEKIRELEANNGPSDSAVVVNLNKQLEAKELECQQLFVMCENVLKDMEEVNRKNKELEDRLKAFL
ncbi:hypothetical protein RCL1_007538 [Eukaryota sp. TZLM3-RCL]